MACFGVTAVVCSDDFDALVQRQVLRTADFKGPAVQPPVGHGQIDEAGNVMNRYEVDRVLAAAENHGRSALDQRIANDAGPQLHEHSWPKDGPLEIAAAQTLLGAELRSIQLQRMVRAGAMDRHQDEAFDASRGRCGDEVPIALQVDLSWAARSWPEAGDGGDDCFDVDERGLQAGRNAYIARDQLDAFWNCGSRRITTEEPHTATASRKQPRKRPAGVTPPTGPPDQCPRAASPPASTTPPASRAHPR